MSVRTDDPFDPPERDPRDLVTSCPVCGGLMERLYSRADYVSISCKECRVSFAIPAGAWEGAHVKRVKPTR